MRHLALALLIVKTCLAESYVFTNLDTNGEPTELIANAGSLLDRPSGAKIEGLKQQILKLAGGHFQIRIKGKISAKVNDRGEASSVPIDVFEGGNWLRSENVPGQEIVVEVAIRDKNPILADKSIKKGYQKISLPTKNGGNGIGSVYEGTFFLSYNLTETEIKRALRVSAIETPKIYAEVTVPTRLSSESSETKPQKTPATAENPAPTESGRPDISDINLR